MCTRSFGRSFDGDPEEQERLDAGDGRPSKEAVFAPFVDMPCTFPVGSDSYPGTVVEVVNAKTIVCARDHFMREDSNGGWSEEQSYRYWPNPSADRVTYTLRKNGSWVASGVSMRCGSGRVILGHRRAYMDPHY